MLNRRYLKHSIPLILSGFLLSTNASAVTLEELAAEMKRLSAENAELRKKVEKLEAASKTKAGPAAPAAVAKTEAKAQEPAAQPGKDEKVVRVNHEHSFQMLDPTTNINQKQLLLLNAKKNGDIGKNKVYLGGAVTPIATYFKSNSDDDFGYLMRHPTSNNQRTKTVSEAVVHSAQLSLTATMGDWVTAFFEALYHPEQSFGAGTNTDVQRNQIEMRKAYVLFGNLDKSPFYASLGKMATPFGLTDTVNPFTNSGRPSNPSLVSLATVECRCR